MVSPVEVIDRLGLLNAEIDDADRRALARQPLAVGTADALRAAGDEGYLAGEGHVHLLEGKGARGKA